MKDIEYSMFCMSSSDLFGCVGLRKKEYCIFNKQYSKEEYARLREKIIGQMNEIPYTDKGGRVYRYGEFFPIQFAPVHYNRTLAIEHFPITKEEAILNNWPWYDAPPTEHQITQRAEELPDSIIDTDESIINDVIRCTECGKAYRLIQPEYDFLRHEGIAAPRLCVDCRHDARIALRNKSKLYSRQCMCDYVVYRNTAEHKHHSEGRCPNQFETSYAPNRPEIVYCEACYQAEVS